MMYSVQAGTLNCPECGAAVTSDSPRCPYCSAMLQTVACTRCKGMMFLGSKFCPHCGAPAKPIAVGAQLGDSCPHCHSALTAIRIGACPAEECTRCGGLFLALADFDRVVSDTEAQTAALGLVLPPPPAIAPHAMYLPCPHCREPMTRTNYAHASGVITSICRPHGIWLERDQIRQIIEFIRSGGLERARQIEKEKIAAAQRALDAKAAMGEGTGDVGNLGDMRGGGDDDDDSPLSLF